MRRLTRLLVLWLVVTPAMAGEWSGYVSGEVRLFPNSPAYTDQRGNNLSFSFEPQYYNEWDNGKQSFTFTPFMRFDQRDDERTHFDIRELTWLKAATDWELRVGVRKVFWGVTESRHLVDIINQTDLVENIDREEKLGQPMINLALIRDFGTIDLFLMPYFRERTFPGKNGRLRTPIPVDKDLVQYESGARKHHVDSAVRWSNSIDIWDIGLSWFHGTSRDPLLIPVLDKRGTLKLAPRYDIIDQVGLDVQATQGSWLWKLEMIRRSGQGKSFAAFTGGFEYTFYGIQDSSADLGVLLEYLYDSRDDAAPTPFEDDVFAGMRLALNDAQSTEVLAGFIIDRDDGGATFNLEASRRLSDNWKLEVEARFFNGYERTNPAYTFRKDDYVEVKLSYHF